MSFKFRNLVFFCFYQFLFTNNKTTCTNAFLLDIFGRCAGRPKCGFFNLGFVMYRGEFDSSSCVEICAYIPFLLGGEYSCGYCTIQPTPSPAAQPPPTPIDTTFDILIDIDDIPVIDRPIFRRARDVWTDIITSDLPDISSNSISDTAGGNTCSFPRTIDDLYVCCFYDDIDGKGKTVGYANPRIVRDGPNGNGLPVTARMAFDTSDIENLKKDNNFEDTIIHEIGHALGIGSLWKEKNLTDVDCNYIGKNALAEYKRLTLCDIMPTTCGHWDETCMNREIMTPTYDTNAALSKITIASLQDLGYTVNYDNAEPFGVFDINVNCYCPFRKRRNKRKLKGSTSNNNNNNKENKQQQNVRIISSAKNNNNNMQGKNHRQLSSKGYKDAVKFGLSILRESRSVEPTEGTRFIGNKLIFVFYIENDNMYSILVENPDL